MASYVERGARHLLIVEDDEPSGAPSASCSAPATAWRSPRSGRARRREAALEQGHVDCIVLDLKLPRTSGFSLLERIKSDERFHGIPVIVYTGKQLTRREETRLSKYAESIIVKDARSPERLLEETTLFLHRPGASCPTSSG